MDGIGPVRIIRPLPRPVGPVQDETLRSYIGRLARANLLNADALRTHLTGAGSNDLPVPVNVLAVISGQTPRALRYAIPELRTEQHLAGTPTGGRPPPHGHSQLRCTHCTLARGHRDAVWCWNHHEDIVCRRHQRWIGDDHDQAEHHQPSLSNHPEILQANGLHRRLIRRNGRETVTTTFGQARQICHHWHRRLEHDDDFYRLMNRFHSGQWRVTSADPTVHAARYPQIVALTRLLASPHWRSRCLTGWPSPQTFVDELRRTVAPNFKWTLQRQYGVHDPLVSHLLDQRRAAVNSRTAVPVSTS